MLEPIVESHNITPVKSETLLPVNPTNFFAKTSVAPVYLSAPAWANKNKKKRSVHHSTSFSIYSLAFRHFQIITNPLDTSGTVRSMVFGSKLQRSSRRWCSDIKNS